MGILDAAFRFSDAQSLVGSAGAFINSTNIYDLGASSPDQGIGNDWVVQCNVGTTFTSAGGNTGLVQAYLIASIATDYEATSYTVVAASSIMVASAMVAGYVFFIRPTAQTIATNPAAIALKLAGFRYLALRYALAGQDITAGTITSSLALDQGADIKMAYPTTYTVI